MRSKTFLATTAEQMRTYLQALRRTRGLSQLEVANALCISRARYTAIEADPGVVSLGQILDVLAVLGGTLAVHVPDDIAREADRQTTSESIPRGAPARPTPAKVADLLQRVRPTGEW